MRQLPPPSWGFIGCLLLLTLLGLSSCVKEPHADNLTPEAGEALVTLRFRAPSASSPNTRGLTHEQENAIEQIDVLVFKGDVSNPRVVFHREGTEITSGSTPNEKNFKVVLPLSAASDTKLVMFANAHVGTMGLGPMVGKTYTEVQAMLMQGITDKLYPSGGAIPMWGETGFVTITSGTTIPISLYRSVARVDVGLGTRTDTPISAGSPLIEYSWDGKKADGSANIPFELEEVYLISPNNAISLMPTQANWLATPKLPTAVGNKFDVASSQSNFKFSGADITSGLYTTRSIYFPESDILMGAAAGATRPGDLNHRNRTALVVGGKYNNGTTTYYRIDFTQAGYLVNVIRNHLFLISITNVSGAGYSTPEEAYNASSMNISTDVVVWDEEDISDIEFDGQYFFGIEKREVVFNPMGGEQVTYKVNSNVSDWTMSITDAGGAEVEVLHSATQRTYENAALGFKYTLADGAQPNSYLLTVESTKHNIQSTPVRRVETLKIKAKRLVLPFVATQESTDLYIGRETSYRYYPEGSTADNQIEIEVASLTSVSVTTSAPWIHLADNTIVREADGVYRGVITATVPSWAQADGMTDRFGQIGITPAGRPVINSSVVQEVPYVMFSEASVLVRTLTRAADWNKVLQVRSNLPVGSIELTADHAADPRNKFSVVGGESSAAFTYPDNYYPRYASMTVEAALNSVETTDGATVVYTARGTAASTFGWVSNTSTFIIQPSDTWYQWQWGWAGGPEAGWNPSVAYVLPWHWNSVVLNVETNRGLGYDLSHSWGSGIFNPSGASVGGSSGGSMAGSKKYPVTFTLPVKTNMAVQDNFGIWLKDDGSITTHPVGIPVQFPRAKQVFSHTGNDTYNWSWRYSTAPFEVTSNVQWRATTSGLDVGIQQPAETGWFSNVERDWRSNTPKPLTDAAPNGPTVGSMLVGTSQMAADKLNNASVTLSGSVTFTNMSGGTDAPTPTTITINQFTPQLRLVNHNIPNPIPSSGGTYQLTVSTNIADAVAVSDHPSYGGAAWGSPNPGVSEAGAAQEYILNVYVQPNAGAARDIYFDIRTYLNGLGEIAPWHIPQLASTKNLTLDYQGYGGTNSATAYVPDTTVPLPVPSATGLVFNGWNTDRTGIGTRYDGGYSMPNNDVTLYADWRVDVTFDGNGHTGGTVPTLTPDQKPNINTDLSAFPIPAGVPTRGAYIFLGWARNATPTHAADYNSRYSSGGTEFDRVATATTARVSASQCTFYAVWLGTMPRITTVDGGQTLTLTDDPADPGLFFKWGSLVGIKGTDSFYSISYFPQISYPGYGVWQDIPCTTTANIGAINQNAATGDPCSIVGLTKAQIAAGQTSGYRLPTYDEYTNFLSSFSYFGVGTFGLRFYKLLSSDWPNFGLNAPGYRPDGGSGGLGLVNMYAYFWTSTPYGTGSAYSLEIKTSLDVRRAYQTRKNGYSVRCVRN